jgi:hypothetical protein
MFFPSQSATSWLGRGIVWTLVLEVLVIAFTPLEVALWSTPRGKRLSQRFEVGRALLDHQSSGRRLGRRAALALVALTLPFALIALGVSRHIPSGAPTRPDITHVTRVVRVVRPVKVERVVKIKTVSQQVPAAPVYLAPTPGEQTATSKNAAHHKPAVRRKPATRQPSSPTKPVTKPEATVGLPSEQTEQPAATEPTTAPDEPGAAG